MTVLDYFYCAMFKLPFSGDFNISVMKGTKVSVFRWLKQTVLQMMKKRKPAKPLQIYPVMLWSKFIFEPILNLYLQHRLSVA